MRPFRSTVLDESDYNSYARGISMALKKQFQEYFSLALKGGEHILRKRTATTMGLRFPAEPYPGRSEIRYEYKLYDGAAGIGIALLDLFRATGDSRYAEVCEDVAYGLIESTPEYGPLHSGLYSGFSGVGLFHLARARVLCSREALDLASEIGIRLGQTKYTDTDLYHGAAGSGLFQIHLYYATGDPNFLAAARVAAEFLSDTAIRTDDGMAWFGRDPKQPIAGGDESYIELSTQIHSGLAHGTAGICLFLLELAQTTGDAEIVELYEEGFRWLNARSIRLQKGLVWLRSETNRVIQK
jgi:lantibiotic modifying enzyme